MSRLALFERLAHAGSAVVVTPNRRLARSLARDFDAWQAGRGQSVWETPDILPFGAFVGRLYDRILHDPSLRGMAWPTSAAQERALWESVIDASGLALATPAAAAALAAEAWALVHQWQVADQFRNYALTEDTRAFADWSAEFERRVRNHGAIDSARVPDAVRQLVADGRAAVPEALLLAGFDELTPQQQALLEVLAARGCRCERLPPSGLPGERTRAPAGDAADELRRMADWVAGRLASGRGRRIGVVVPDLAARRRAVVRALDSVLEPDVLLRDPDRPRPYTVSLGGSFAEVPLVGTALRLLRFVVGEVDFQEASLLLRARHVDFGARSTREGFDAELRRRVGRRTGLDEVLAFARRSSAFGASPLRTTLDALHAWRSEQGRLRRRCSDWAARLTDVLRTAGFPGPESLDSAEYQAHARWRELMSEFAALDRVVAPLGLAEAVSSLRRLAASTNFQAEGGDPPVQVLGLLEANGLEFDHLWLLGMSIDAWPPPARPHPLLAIEMQRHRGMPGARVEAELARARAVLDRLTCASPDVVASHPTREDDRAVAPSPMIAAWPAAEPVAQAARAIASMPRAALEEFADSTAPALAAGTKVAGGVATLDAQAACPFRAFALHRLRAQPLDVPHDGFDPMERGTMAHEVMRHFWDDLPQRTRAFLAALPAEELASRLGLAADRAIADVRRRRGGAPGETIASIERSRLVALATEWLRFEVSMRPDFAVLRHEDRRELVVGGLTLSGRLDRIDTLPDGRTVVLDYKTGSGASVGDWLGARPDAPQLPLYLVATQPEASAIAIARLRKGGVGFVCLGEDDDVLPGASTRWTQQHPTWSALVDAWRAGLEELAAEFAQGRADAAPKDPRSCAQCPARMVCRIVERGNAAPAGDEP